MKIKLLLLIIFSAIAVNCFAFEQDFQPQNNLTVGDKAVLKIKADGLTLDSIDKDKTALLNFGDFELLDIKQSQDGAVDFILSCYKAGKAELLSVEIAYISNEQSKFVKTKAIPLEIKSVLNPQNPSRDILDIKEIIYSGYGFWRYFKIILLACLAVLLLYFAYKFFKKRKHKPSPQEIIRLIPPKEYALSQLKDLRNLNLIEQGQIKDYYDKLSDILRFYVSRVYEVDGMEKTTAELFMLLKNKAPADYNRELRNYLADCDLVKFAKVIPSVEDSEQDFQKAEKFVERI